MYYAWWPLPVSQLVYMHVRLHLECEKENRRDLLLSLGTANYCNKFVTKK